MIMEPCLACSCHNDDASWGLVTALADTIAQAMPSASDGCATNMLYQMDFMELHYNTAKILTNLE